MACKGSGAGLSTISPRTEQPRPGLRMPALFTDVGSFCPGSTEHGVGVWRARWIGVGSRQPSSIIRACRSKREGRLDANLSSPLSLSGSSHFEFVICVCTANVVLFLFLFIYFFIFFIFFSFLFEAQGAALGPVYQIRNAGCESPAFTGQELRGEMLVEIVSFHRPGAS